MALPRSPRGGTAKIAYGELKGYNANKVEHCLVEHRDGLSADEYVEGAQKLLHDLVRLFDDPATPYHSQPRAQYTNDWGDYDQLARRGEWAQAGEEGE